MNFKIGSRYLIEDLDVTVKTRFYPIPVKYFKITRVLGTLR